MKGKQERDGIHSARGRGCHGCSESTRSAGRRQDPSRLRGGAEGRGWDLRCFRWSAGRRRSRSRRAWKACCSRWRPHSWPPLWESPRRRTSPRPEATRASMTNVHRGGGGHECHQHLETLVHLLLRHFRPLHPSQPDGAVFSQPFRRLGYRRQPSFFPHILFRSYATFYPPVASALCGSSGCYSRLTRPW